MPCGQQYAAVVAHWFVSLVLDCGASLRCAAKVFELFLARSEGHDETEPDRSTGRLWLLRIGLAALLRPKVIATTGSGWLTTRSKSGSANAWSSWAYGFATFPRAGRSAIRTWS